MMKKVSFLLALLTGFIGFSQSSEEDEDKIPHEIGLDGYFGAGSTGGSFGLGLKYSIVKEESPQYAFGPSFRIQRTWSNNQQTSQTFSYNIIGLGAFAHARVYEVLFAGVEFEMMNSPLRYDLANQPKSWIPTLFVGGGYSQMISDSWRLNLGIFYDVIDHANSPFRPSYTARKTVNGQPGPLIPVLYRLALFIQI